MIAATSIPNSLTLLPEAAVWHAPSRTLIVSDVHLGKSAAFRAHGVPVPDGDDAHDLASLARLVARESPSRLVIAGDLFHAPSGITPELRNLLGDFLTEINIPLVLTIGNHDAKIPTLPPGITAVPHFDLPGQGPRVIHDPADVTPGLFHIAGHLHPVVRIRDGRLTSLRLPCFWRTANQLVLPSFGTFTGGAIIQPTKDDAVFAAMRGKIVEIPPALWR